MTATLAELRSTLKTARAALIDLDGTLLAGGRLLPGAAEFLQYPPCPFVIVSNDSEHTPAQLARKLRGLGVVVPPDRFILAGIVAIESLAQRAPGEATMVLGSPAMRHAARVAGIHVTDTAPRRILLMRDRSFTYARLAAAAAAIFDGAAVTLACPDLSHPGRRGEPVPEAGALAAALQACAGPFELEIIGKPEPALFAAAARRLGVEPGDCVMVGDNPDTDGLGAARFGMPFYLVSRSAPGDRDPARMQVVGGDA